MTAVTAATERAPATTPASVPLRPRLAVAGIAQPLLLLANGNASGVLRRRELVDGLRELLRLNGARVETLLTESPDELAALLPRDPDRRVALVGGDGTIHAAANLPGPIPELALIPAGSANNIARSLGIPTDARVAAEVAVSGVARRLDLIEARADDRRYLAVEGVSVGFLALARARYRSRNSADLSAALTSGLGALARFRPLCVALESDGAAEVIRISQLFAANLSRYGPGLRVAPEADVGDGLLDLVAVEGKGRLSVPAMLARLRRGSHVGRPDTRHWQARRVRIATGGRSPVIADSTNLGSGPVDLEVLPGALSLVVPSR